MYALDLQGQAGIIEDPAISPLAGRFQTMLLRTPAISLLFERGSFTSQSTALVANVFAGLAPSLIGFTLMDLISRCCFALDRPRLPLIAAFVPVMVNGLFLGALRWSGHLNNPLFLGLGASTGLLAGFSVLLIMTRTLRPRYAA